VEPIYLEARNAGGPSTIATAAADDVFFQATLGDIEAVLSTMIDACKREGVELTRTKCYLFDPYDDSQPTPAAAVKLTKKYGIDMKKGCAVQLGAAIGLDEDKRINFIKGKIDEIVKVTHQTVSSMSFPAQCAPKYLQQVAKSSAVYLTATHCPRIMQEPLLSLANRLQDIMLSLGRRNGHEEYAHSNPDEDGHQAKRPRPAWPEPVLCLHDSRRARGAFLS
jgi:hypothetical protein